MLADQGRAKLADVVHEKLKLGRRVIAVDPYYYGESKIGRFDWLFSLLIATVGERPLGVQAAQVNAVGRWARETFGTAEVRLLSVGPRTGVAARVAGALEPQTFKQVETREPLTSLRQLITENRSVSASPELFCLGLLERFDLPQLEALGPK